MNIRFTSSLTSDDENLIAPLIVNTLAGILDLLPLAYMIRIDTVDSRVYQHVGSKDEVLGLTKLPQVRQRDTLAES